MKIGLDIHGVIDANQEFFAFYSNNLIQEGSEVHILTGPRWTDELRNQIKGYGIKWTHEFSITDYNLKVNPDKVTFDEKGNPHAPKELWNSAKGIYAHEVGLNMHWDDSPEYFDYFPKTCECFYYKKMMGLGVKFELARQHT